MSFLEWLLTKYLGQPTLCRGNGESQWNCPQCGHARFHTMPDRPPFKHRARCWVCNFRGDALDMLHEFHPDETYGDRRDRLAKLQEEYRREQPEEFSFRGAGRAKAAEPRDDPDAVAAAFADLHAAVERPVPDWATDVHLAAWRLLAHAADAAWSNGVTLDSLAGYCARSLLEYREALREHAAGCNDPDCGVDCRRTRAAMNNGRK